MQKGNNKALVRSRIEIVEGAIEGVTTRVKTKLVKVLKSIIEQEHRRLPEYVKLTGINTKSLERYIKTLREAGLIDFTEGGTNVGGYFITSKLIDILRQ